MSEQYGAYELLRHIATGGMAEIHLARHRGPGAAERLVVVKRMLPQLAVRSDFVAMFEDEARLTSTLLHPNIVRVYELGQHQGSYFIAMELIDGPHLGSLFAHSLRARAPLPLDLCCWVVARAADGLHYAHERHDPSTGAPLNLVHRDISPQNILISRHGEVKVTDFGVAKATTQQTKTRTGIIKGKVAYMSPEQCLGETIDRRTDVFALGIVLYELVTRRRLFHHLKSDLLVMQEITSRDVAPPSTVNPSVDARLDAILGRALARDPNQRFASSAELAAALDTLLDRRVGDRALAAWFEANCLSLAPSQQSTITAAPPPSSGGDADPTAATPSMPEMAAAQRSLVPAGRAGVVTPAGGSSPTPEQTVPTNAAPRVASGTRPAMAPAVGKAMSGTAPASTPPDDSPAAQGASSSSAGLGPASAGPAFGAAFGPTFGSPFGSLPDSGPGGPMSEATSGLASLRADDESIGSAVDATNVRPGRRRAAMLAIGVAVLATVLIAVLNVAVVRKDEAGAASAVVDPAAALEHPAVDAAASSPSPTPSPPSPAPLSTSTGRLHIETSPSGVPIIAGEAQVLGRSPVDVELPVGAIRVQAQFADQPPRGVDVVVKAGETATAVVHAWVPLRVRSTPTKAKVRVDGALRGETPFEQGFLVEPGRAVTVRLEAPGFAVWEEQRTAVPGTPLDVAVKLAPVVAPAAQPVPVTPARDEQGAIRVNVEPWAFVTLDNLALGEAPFGDKRVAAGRHTLTLTNPEVGLKDSIPVVIPPGKTLVVILRYEKKGTEWVKVKKDIR